MAHLIFGECICALIEQAAQDRLQCPRCQGTSLYRDGKADGLQRYRCRQCGRTFNALTGTPLARLRHKDRWLTYFDCLRDPACTVRRAAEKTGVHANTSFRWRHRFKGWLRHFNGVATRYLPNYLGWRWAIDGNRIATAEGFLRAALGFFRS